MGTAHAKEHQQQQQQQQNNSDSDSLSSTSSFRSRASSSSSFGDKTFLEYDDFTTKLEEDATLKLIKEKRNEFLRWQDLELKSKLSDFPAFKQYGAVFQKSSAVIVQKYNLNYISSPAYVFGATPPPSPSSATSTAAAIAASSPSNISSRNINAEQKKKIVSAFIDNFKSQSQLVWLVRP